MKRKHLVLGYKSTDKDEVPEVLHIGLKGSEALEAFNDASKSFAVVELHHPVLPTKRVFAGFAKSSNPKKPPTKKAAKKQDDA